MIQNVTVRVPWTDNGWCGKICNNPCGNNDCLRLRNIYENKNESEEQKLAGKAMQGYEQYLPCIAEGAAFMSPDKLVRTVIHPYKQNNPETHGHFLETDEIFEPYSLPARPFLWTMMNLANLSYLLKIIGFKKERITRQYLIRFIKIFFRINHLFLPMLNKFHLLMIRTGL